jgi:TonB family protein
MKRNLMASILVFSSLTLLASAQVSTPQRVRASESIMQGLTITKVAPVYPPLARQAQIQGPVILKVQISKSGDVVNIQLVSGHPLLAPAAIDAVTQWKYKPYLLNGESTAVETSATVNFTLSDKPAPASVAGDVPGGVPPGEEGGIAPGNPGDQTHPAPPSACASPQA